MPTSSRIEEVLAEPTSNGTLSRTLGSITAKTLARNARKIVLISLALAAVLIATYCFFTRPLFFSNTYVSATSENIVRMNVLLQSPLILDPAAEKAGLDLSSHDIARSRMNDRISFKPAAGTKSTTNDNRQDIQIFLLSIKDPNPQIAHDVSNLVLTKWKDGLTPRSFERERMESDLARQLQKKSDLDNIISHFGKDVTSYVTPQTNSGELATPFVSLLNQRMELAKKIEDLRYLLDGGSAFTVITGPTEPDDARRPIGWLTLLIGSIVGSLLLTAGVFISVMFWREASTSTSQHND